MRHTRDIEVTITVDQFGDITCRPTVIHVIPGDKVFFAADGPFAIVAKGLSCFGRVDVRGTSKTEVEIPRGCNPGVYSFACAVFKNGMIYMDACCPDFVYDPGSGGDH
mgnify:CR=1 FL=1|jgi:hypothetical protein